MEEDSALSTPSEQQQQQGGGGDAAEDALALMADRDGPCAAAVTFKQAAQLCTTLAHARHVQLERHCAAARELQARPAAHAGMLLVPDADAVKRSTAGMKLTQLWSPEMAAAFEDGVRLLPRGSSAANEAAVHMYRLTALGVIAVAATASSDAELQQAAAHVKDCAARLASLACEVAQHAHGPVCMKEVSCYSKGMECF